MAIALRHRAQQTEARLKSNGRVTMKDVANLAGVTSMTVSRTLRRPEMVAQETRERVLEVVQETGFIPNLAAGTLSATRSPIVTAVVATLSEPSMAGLAQGLSDVLSDAGYQLLLNQSRFDPKIEENLVRAALGWTPSAVVLAGMTHTRTTRTILQRAGVPVFEVNEIGSRPIDTAVGISNFEGGRQAALYMASRGKKRIGFLHHALKHNERMRRRREGFLKGLEEAGLEPDLHLCCEVSSEPEGGAFGLRTMRKRFADLDGIIATNEREAVGALMECIRQGIDVPGQIGVIGWGDSEFSAQMVPSLSTVRVPREETGRRTGQLILDRLKGIEPEDKVIDLGFEIIEREST